MLSFKGFLAEASLTTSGPNADRHFKKYVKDYLPGGSSHGEGTHAIAKSGDGFNAGDAVTIHGHRIDDSGKHMLTVSKTGSNEKKEVIASRLTKPIGKTQTENKGHLYEKAVFDRFKEHGLVPHGYKPAGSTAGTDVPILNKKKNVSHGSRIVDPESRNLYSGEVKKDTTAAFGQLTIQHHPDKGWHIPDKARANRPKFAKAIEDAGILEHMNKHHPNPHESETTESGRAKTITMKHPDLKPAESYLQDHHVDVLQVGGGHGTYSVGEKDATGHGLPRLSGKGKWSIREKQFGNKTSRTVAFQPDGKKGLDNSHINLDHDEHMTPFKKTLGHA